MIHCNPKPGMVSFPSVAENLRLLLFPVPLQQHWREKKSAWRQQKPDSSSYFWNCQTTGSQLKEQLIYTQDLLYHQWFPGCGHLIERLKGRLTFLLFRRVNLWNYNDWIWKVKGIIASCLPLLLKTQLSSPSPQPLSPQSPKTQSQSSPTQFKPQKTK